MKLSKYLILLLTSILIACGGGGGSSSSSSTTTTATITPSVGQFIDAPVSGLTYVCGSYSGTTNDLGQFNYSTDSTCSFTIGNVVVGSLSSVPSDGMVTPHDVAGVSRTSDDDPNVQAIAQFLQSVGTTSGGVITISSTVRQNLQSAPANTAIFTSTGPLSQSALSNLVVMGAPSKTLINSTVAKTAMKADIQQRGINTSIGVVKPGSPVKMSAISISSTLTSVPQGLSTQLAASGNFTDGTTSNITNSVTWSSSNTSVATVSSRGIVTAVSTGTTTITARSAQGFINTLLITVSSATLTSITVTPASSNMARALTQQMVATGTYSDGTSAVIPASTVTWSSSSTAIATISSSGVVMGIALGSTTINATVGSVSASTPLAVSKTIQSIAVTTANSVTSIPVGIAVQLTATGTLSDGSTVNLSNLVTWVATSNATVSSTGLFTGITTSTVVPVTASYVGVTSSARSITLTNPTLQSIAITATTSSTAPTASQAPAGYAQNLIATGTYSNGTTQIITTSLTWTSATQSIATVTSGSAGGRVTGVATGTSVITATDSTSGVSKSVTFTVTAPVLTSIAVSSPSAISAIGRSEQLVATATYSDSSTANVSNTVTWSSSNTSLATVSSTGLLTTITSSSNPITISAALNSITSPSVSVNPGNTVGGTISGLSGTLILKNNGGDSLAVSANGSFIFATAIAFGGSYVVTVGTQPSEQICTVTSGSGAASTTNITNISISCRSNFEIATQPTNQSVNAGQTAQFSVTATGSNLTYQWYKNGSVISGATASSYTTPATTSLDTNSTFSVIVSKGSSTITSSSATLTVIFTNLTNLQISEVGTCFSSATTCWFEIYNPTSSPINLSGYRLNSSYANYSTGAIFSSGNIFTFPSLSIPASSYLIVSGNVVGLAQRGTQLVGVVSGSLAPYWGANGFIELQNSAGTATVDFVRFGTSTQSPITSSAWTSASVAALPSSSSDFGKSIVRLYPYNAYTDTNTAADWTAVDWATPGGRNDIPAGTLDADGDGIPDSAEVSGGTYAGIDLYAMGSRTDKKDIFIEVDYMNSTDAGIIPRSESLQMVVNAFAAKNISVHFDTGTQFSATFSTANFNLGQGSNVVAYEKCVTFDQNTCSSNTSTRRSIYDWKAEYMDLRRRNIFHYLLMGNSQLNSGASDSSGRAELPGNDLIVTMGGTGWGLSTTVGTKLNTLINIQASTIMHELGHNLGLRHGGSNDVNFKPNYYSIMNYIYQLNGLDSSPSGINAYQRWRRYIIQGNSDGVIVSCSLPNSRCGPPSEFVINYSDGTGSSLNEAALIESSNIGRGSTNGAYADWNLNGLKDTGSISKDLDGNGSASSTLTDYHDWNNLVLPFSRYYQAQFGASLFSSKTSNIQALDPMSNDKQPLSIETPPSAKFFEQLRNER
ncbi:MAG: Ig-like domain-containing protein [Polynucleobacter sp.]|nr:Ig-like domain-containing protein [Polynucleobacter sp.]